VGIAGQVDVELQKNIFLDEEGNKKKT